MILKKCYYDAMTMLTGTLVENYFQRTFILYGHAFVIRKI